MSEIPIAWAMCFMLCVSAHTGHSSTILEHKAISLSSPKRVTLGVYVIYTDDFATKFANYHHDRHEARGYFRSLLKAVELRFGTTMPIILELILVGSRTSPAIDAACLVLTAQDEGAPVDAEATLGKLKQCKQDDRDLKEADVLLLLTTKSITRSNQASWPGNATPQGICTCESVGLATDDGRTFSGTHQVSVELALLLRATRDTEGGETDCLQSQGYLLSSRFGGLRYQPSRCSEFAMFVYLTQVNPSEQCWNDAPQEAPFANEYPKQFPSDYMKAKNTDICKTKIPACVTRLAGDIETCKVNCCGDMEGDLKLYVDPPAPDGTPCQDDGVKLLS
ncbi:uncharacterized protein LOC8053370 [Ixodes scapularis]|uniref:uncharacterized protein LOC8053370 n=1 Tax=Ixodes scapularis TaxID=6945 RepID=UPI001C388D19|nr:uncharacterized protein LOC8053370 [Ixodes scapularis]